MKQIACYILTFLLLFSLAGCAQTQDFQESDADLSTVSETTTPAETAVPAITKTPVVTEASVITKTTAEATPPSKPIPTTTEHAFDVYSVEMQDTPGSSCFSEVGLTRYGRFWLLSSGIVVLFTPIQISQRVNGINLSLLIHLADGTINTLKIITNARE